MQGHVGIACDCTIRGGMACSTAEWRRLKSPHDRNLRTFDFSLCLCPVYWHLARNPQFLHVLDVDLSSLYAVRPSDVHHGSCGHASRQAAEYMKPETRRGDQEH